MLIQKGFIIIIYMNRSATPTNNSSYYYTKATALLKQSSHQYVKALKQKSIVQMIGEQKNRRKLIENVKLSKIQSIHADSSKDYGEQIKLSCSVYLFQKRRQNSLIKNSTEKSVKKSKEQYFNRKKSNAQSVRGLISEIHKRSDKQKKNQMKKTFSSSRTLYLERKQNIHKRLQQMEEYRKNIILKNQAQVQSLLKKKKKLDKKIMRESWLMSNSAVIRA